MSIHFQCYLRGAVYPHQCRDAPRKERQYLCLTCWQKRYSLHVRLFKSTKWTFCAGTTSCSEHGRGQHSSSASRECLWARICQQVKSQASTCSNLSWLLLVSPRCSFVLVHSICSSPAERKQVAPGNLQMLPSHNFETHLTEAYSHAQQWFVYTGANLALKVNSMQLCESFRSFWKGASPSTHVM